MRVKTEARRQAILATAADVFQEVGFDAASMAEIAVRTGGSKATLYNYFSSKEELFVEVMLSSAQKQGRDMFFAALQRSGDLQAILQNLGQSFLKIIMAPEIVAMRRIVISQSGRSDLGRLFYERGPKSAWAQVTDLLQSAIDNRVLRPADARIMTMHLKSLYEAEVVELQLLGVISKVTRKEIERIVAAAVEVFMRAYGASPAGNAEKKNARS
ncbi:TetR/AcrR family transcriptional regulator [Noviherbaspirillum massiliense]|uniref:TetR/AcrR family transcriptional regulator n=1 Tax=Noviherbaspirillum massiliense TaxID=1465823 RepID=UPI0003182BD9|nr:TetR/AcrR family transcriptional regulator [Noviherbaspirillum massiliense]